jgi:hypothetical protein
MKTAKRFCPLAALAFLPALCHGQLYVDFGGPRDLFVQPSSAKSSSAPAAGSNASDSGASGDTQTDSATNFFSFDSQKEQVGLNFLNLGRWPTYGPLVWGGTVTAASPNNDPSDIFKLHESPTIQGNVLANITEVNVKADTAYSFTFKIANAYNTFPLVASASATKVSKPSLNEPSGSICYAYAWSNPLFFDPEKDRPSQYLRQAIAITVGAARADNYQSLPQTTLANSQTARIGTLNEFDSYPIQLLYVGTLPVYPHTKGGNAWDEALKAAGFSDDNSYLDLSPYANFTPRHGGIPSFGFGFNVALEVAKPDPKVPSKGKLSYPWSVYVERDRKFNSAGYVTTYGVSKVLSF